MNANWVLLVLLLIVLATAFYLFFWPKINRKRISKKSFPQSWIKIIEARLSIHRKLKAHLQHQLDYQHKLLLDDNEVNGCRGLRITG